MTNSNQTLTAEDHTDLTSPPIEEDGRTIPFLRRLTEMLQEKENDEVISFYPGGSKPGQSPFGHIVVHDRKRMEKEILPKYFNHSSFASLRRQLNYFAFARVGKSRQKGATYCNEGVVHLQDILRLKRRLVGSPTPSAGTLSPDNDCLPNPREAGAHAGFGCTKDSSAAAISDGSFHYNSSFDRRIHRNTGKKRCREDHKDIAAAAEQGYLDAKTNKSQGSSGTALPLQGGFKNSRTALVMSLGQKRPSWRKDCSAMHIQSPATEKKWCRNQQQDHHVSLQDEDLLVCAALINLGGNHSPAVA